MQNKARHNLRMFRLVQILMVGFISQHLVALPKGTTAQYSTEICVAIFTPLCSTAQYRIPPISLNLRYSSATVHVIPGD